RDRSFPDVVLLVLLIAFLYRIATNRSDAEHMVMGLWAPVLALLFASAGERQRRPAIQGTAGRVILVLFVVGAVGALAYAAWVPLPVLALLVALLHLLPERAVKSYLAPALLILVAVNAGFHAFRAGSEWQTQFRWVRMLDTPPKNISLVSDGARWVAGELRRTASLCIFDFSNNGILNGVAILPACTRFAYPVYATSSYESEMFQALRENDPSVVVYSTTFWSFSIDGRTMHERFPAVRDYIAVNYPYEQCRYEYCLRYKTIVSMKSGADKT
ncbi:MAG: hypothetical protein HGA47_07435, partial [Zoogloea sp.]|nr:hypothetical protein [Zoogloea sp.]